MALNLTLYRGQIVKADSVGSVFGATSARDERGMGPWMAPGAENTIPIESFTILPDRCINYMPFNFETGFNYL